MCGIVGYFGRKAPVPLIVESLKTLEYRGYDSAGVAYLNENNLLEVYKASGKLINLENRLPDPLRKRDENGRVRIGIGHIRWATHGAANDTNAHPHLSTRQEVALVHNGIIENFFELRKELQAAGQQFLSETDTECVVQLLEHLSRNGDDFLQVMQAATRRLKGAYALTVISRKNPDKLYAVRNQAPLVIGIGEGETLVASDAVAFAQYTDRVIYLKDHQIAEISPEGVRVFDLDGNPVDARIEVLETGPLMVDKKGFKHFMLKEIFEQPDVIRNSLSGRLLAADQPVQLLSREEDSPGEVEAMLRKVSRVLIVACGTSLNAGMVAKYFIEELGRVPVDVESAGEFRYRKPVMDDATLVVVVSQSGETADTLAALRMAREEGAKIVAVTNREDSTIARESDIVLPVRAGVEVSVAATKSFTAQMTVLYLLGIMLAEQRGSIRPDTLAELKSALFRIPALIEAVLTSKEAVQEIAKKYAVYDDAIFIARGVNYPVAIEGALKLKEISYIHAEGYSGSELKHGPIAMLDDKMPVFSVLAGGDVFEKMISNCQEAKARDAKVVAFTTHELTEDQRTTFEDVFVMPEVPELLSPLVTTVPMQLLAYFMAEYLGKDVDQPRNLAKSVTVE